MWFRLRRLLSYVFPFTRTVASGVSGSLEITWYKGRKVLDTRHANYSYGSLHKVLRYGLMFVAPAQAQHILLLGLGGGSAVQILRQQLQYAGHITALDLDPAVIEIAGTEFGIRADEHLAIHCADAFAWVRTGPDAAFDLIIVDLFIDLNLPEGLQTAAFWQHVRRLLAPGGYVLFNALASAPLAVEGVALAEYLATLGFTVKDLEVEQLNRLLILQLPMQTPLPEG